MKLRWHYLKHITCVQVQNVVAVSVQFSPIGIGHWSSLRHLLLLYMMLLRNFDELDTQNHSCARYFLCPCTLLGQFEIHPISNVCSDDQHARKGKEEKCPRFTSIFIYSQATKNESILTLQQHKTGENCKRVIEILSVFKLLWAV